jgi:hypothetical protein
VRVFEVIDLADMHGRRMRELEADALAMPASRRAPPRITVTSCGMSACAGSWVIV